MGDEQTAAEALMREIRQSGDAIAHLARNRRTFESALGAFRSRDADLLRAQFATARVEERCELVCDWLCTKLCLLTCIRMCGGLPPPVLEEGGVDQLRRLARVTARLCAREEALERLAAAVEREDANAFAELAEDFEFGDLCFFICRFVCVLRCRLFCELVCQPKPGRKQSLVADLRRAGTALGRLVEDEKAFPAAVDRFLAGDCDGLRSAITPFLQEDTCEVICFWICNWECVLRCLRLCGPPPDLKELPAPEIREFAQVTGRIAADPKLVAQLVAAVDEGNAKAFDELVTELKLARFCHQLCLWVCAFRCRLFCECVCPPIVCTLTDPIGCVAETVDSNLPALVVAVRGTAAGGGFSHYVLQWSQDGITWHASNFHYPPIPPGPMTQGNTPVINGLLAEFETTLLNEGPYFIRMTVFSAQGVTSTCQIQFSLFKQDVRILGVDDDLNLDASPFDPNARFVETVPTLCARTSGIFEVSFGGCISVQGSAFVGGCEGRRVNQYTLDYKPGFETNPISGGWTNFWAVTYTTAAQKRALNDRRDTSDLTAFWGPDCLVPIPFPPFCLLSDPQAKLDPSCWNTHVGTCQLSGLYTLRLGVEDTASNWYWDTQRIWLDNKPICAKIRIDAVPACADVNLSDFANPPDCGNPWPLPLSGIAWDEYIDDLLPLTRPNDNFDFYWVSAVKQGGTEFHIPIPGPTPGLSSCFYGISRVGDPITRCVPCSGPGGMFGTLATFDLRAVDPVCSGSVAYAIPADFKLPRGECCTYVFKVHVQDRTIFPGGPHWAEAIWPVRICNDLK